MIEKGDENIGMLRSKQFRSDEANFDIINMITNPIRVLMVNIYWSYKTKYIIVDDKTLTVSVCRKVR